jgi:hypothetical protein
VNDFTPEIVHGTGHRSVWDPFRHRCLRQGLRGSIPGTFPSFNSHSSISTCMS